MSKPNNTEAAFEGLAMYAAERRAEFNAHPSACEQREKQIRNILRGMTERWGEMGFDELIRRFDERLVQTGEHPAAGTAPLSVQKDTIKALSRYASVIAVDKGDPRPKLSEVRDLLKELWLWRPWDGLRNGVLEAKDMAVDSMIRATARQPIRFTRVLIGPETGPCEVDYMPGLVSTPEQVRDMELFKRLSEEYPAKKEWPAVCVCYGASDRVPVRDASAEDIELIRYAGDHFLDLPTVRNLTGCYEIQITEEPSVSVFHVRERGAEEWFKTAEGVELLEAAELLRKYDSHQTSAHRFSELFPDHEQITPEQFAEWESLRLENTGRVSGAFEIDFNVGQFSALNLLDGWVTFGIQDVKAAARQAFREDDMSRNDRWRTLLDDLSGKEITVDAEPCFSIPDGSGMTMQ